MLQPRVLTALGNRVLKQQPPSWSIAPCDIIATLLMNQSTQSENDNTNKWLNILNTEASKLNVSAGTWNSLSLVSTENDAAILELSRKLRVFVFGRAADLCDHVLADSSYSRQHAAIVFSADGPQLVDLFSSHGSSVNGVRCKNGQPYPLKDQDRIVFANKKEFIVNMKPLTEQQIEDERRNGKQMRIHDRDNENDRKHVRDQQLSNADEPMNKRRNDTDTVTASHILVKHAGSRRPSSHRTGNVTRSLEEATDMIKKIREQLVASKDTNNQVSAKLFADLAQEYSDCSSFRRGGDLGPFAHNKMQKAFADAAFALKVGELSDPVVSDSGVHIILRTK
jgi:NIMA-interacting peptidyl-prolyl cis-trans isomerase 1